MLSADWIVKRVSNRKQARKNGDQKHKGEKTPPEEKQDKNLLSLYEKQIKINENWR